MTELDARVHHELLAGIVRTGHAPSIAELAAATRTTRVEVDAALRSLADEHGLLLHPRSSEVWVAHPFSLSPTGTWVESANGGWWAPCLWCAFGIAAIVAGELEIHTRAGAEAGAIRLRVRDGQLDARDAAAPVVHLALPPRVAWDNVVHWCASVQPFARAEDVPRWCERHGYTPGAIVPAAKVLALGRAWYGGYLEPRWRKHTVAEAQEIFTRTGLTGAFWALPVSDERF